MSTDPLSTRSLEQAKKAAKRLRKALAQAEPDAVDRFIAVFRDRKDPATANHSDCLHVIAREAGAESWPRLKIAVETATLDREARVVALERAVANGNFWMMDRLLSLEPGLADAHFGLQLALVREGEALTALDRNPGLAMTPIGRRWPIHHLCFSKLHQHQPGRVPDMISLLDALLVAGADLNQGYPAEPGSDHMLSPLYGALGHAQNLPLARTLLERGADPNDNESLYHATELDDLEGVRLLFAHGAEIGTTNAFFRMLDKENADGLRLFLANGADPNGPVYQHPSDQPADERNALHHAIFRGRSGEIGAILLEHGVDTSARYDGRTPYGLAVACGNHSMAAMLEARGLATPLNDAERFLAAIGRLDGEEALRLLAAKPSLLRELTEKDLARPTDLAISAENLPVLKLMADLGFDPNRKGEGDTPPIHAAAWWGHADIVEMYLGFGVELESLNMYGGTALGTTIHGSANCPGRDRGDYVRCVELLLNAGAKIRLDDGDLEMGSEEVTLILEDWMEHA
ncbi:MAG: ankyrin repeat domain-containing protein [Pseudomonadota bacterium]